MGNVGMFPDLLVFSLAMGYTISVGGGGVTSKDWDTGCAIFEGTFLAGK